MVYYSKRYKMALDTIFQHWVATDFIYPFLLVFFIAFAVLEKSKVLGEDKKQLNALVAFVLGLILVGAVFPKQVISNMILFLTVSLVIVFVVLLLWGFVSGDKINDYSQNATLKWVFFAVVLIASIIAVLWATGFSDSFFETVRYLFNEFLGIKPEFWLNALFVIVVAGAVAWAIKQP